MPLFIDYTYTGSHPAPDNLKTLKSYLTRTTPAPPAAASKNLKSEAVHAMTATAADFYWHATTMGYGEAAQYIIKWILSSGKLTTIDVADLKRLTRTRAQTIFRAYELAVSGGGALLITPRPIYSIIDPTEKGLISYYLGSAMASMCGPVAVAQRGTAIGIKYIFHSKVLEANAAFGHSITVQAHPKSGSAGASSKNGRSIPDFIGLDATNAPHVFEAKGEGSGTLYPPLANGLDQCGRVISITFPLPGPPIVVPPASLNVCAAFMSKIGVTSNLGPVTASVRCAVVSIPYKSTTAVPPTSSKTVKKAIKAMPTVPLTVIQQLVGTQLLGLYGQLLLISQ